MGIPMMMHSLTPLMVSFWPWYAASNCNLKENYEVNLIGEGINNKDLPNGLQSFQMRPTWGQTPSFLQARALLCLEPHLCRSSAIKVKVNLCVNLIRFIRFFWPNIPRPIFLTCQRFFQDLPLSPFHSFTLLHIPLVIQNLLIDATLPDVPLSISSGIFYFWNILSLYILIWFHWINS